MSRSTLVFFAMLALNALLAAGYLIWRLLFKKDTDNRKQYWMNAVIMLVCPIVGVLYFLLSYLKYRFVKVGKIDLSDVEFSKQRHTARVKADENRERNIVSVGEAILVSDREKKRANMLNVLLGETDESFAAIALAMDSDDSEVAHYAASFLQSKMDTFRDNVRRARQIIDEGDIEDEECQNRILRLLRYMNYMLEQRVFTPVEQADYTEQMEQLCERLFCHARHKITSDCYEWLLGRLTELKKYGQAELWGNRFYEQYPDLLASYSRRLKLYFELGNRDRFFEVLDELMKSSATVDSRTLELIRMIQRPTA